MTTNVSSSAADFERAADLYLGAMVKILTNTIYEDSNINPRKSSEYEAERRKVGKDWPQTAFTMIGVKRLENLRMLAERVLREGVPGDLIETGVWRGGACIMMRAVLAAYGDTTRKVFCADSFAGLPSPNAESFPKDAKDTHHQYHDQLAIPRAAVEAAFQKFDLLDDQVEFLEGYFKDTLPSVKDRTFALLRLDGDMYESTIQALEILYPRLSPGGFIILDDVGAVKGCKAAMNDYRDAHNITEPIQEADWTGVWWQKARA